jgi:Family of unknown function (DUF6719)
MKAVIAICAMLTLTAATALAQPVLKREPAPRELRSGKRVLVDDGSCPKGQIKQVTGGSRDKGIRRSRRCVARR